jgi:hypothetical protein
MAAAARCGTPPLLLETADGVLGRTDTAGDRRRMARLGNACPRNFLRACVGSTLNIHIPLMVTRSVALIIALIIDQMLEAPLGS